MARIDPCERRRDIVRAAFRLVVAEGVAGMSLRKVAAESGLNIGSVRHYFRGHDELLIAAAEEAGDRMGRRLAGHPVEALRGLAGDAARDALQELVEAVLPMDEERATVIHGLGVVMAADGANLPAARAFLGYLGSEEAAVIQAEMGAANPAFEGTQDDWLASAPDFDLQVFLDAVEYAQPYPVSENAAAWNQLESELLPQGFSGQRPIEEVAAELAEGMNAVLAEE